MSNHPLLDVIQYAKESIHPATMVVAVVMLIAFVMASQDSDDDDDENLLLLSLWRQFEGKVGGVLLQVGGQRMIDNAGLIKKQIIIPKSGLTVHYYERNPTASSSNDPTTTTTTTKCNTLLLCHGMTSEAKNLAALVAELAKELPHMRMIVPDIVGHGHDLDRLLNKKTKFEYPQPETLGDSMMDLLDVLEIKECFAYGTSMGGALVYFLQQKRPHLIKKSLLISPALEAVIDDQFLKDFKTGTKNHFCYTSRSDVQTFMKDLSCGPTAKVQNPIPSFLLQAIWDDRKKRDPTHQHFRTFFQTMVDARGKDPGWLGCPKDCAPQLPRLVLWPEQDYISNFERGKAFFEDSCSPPPPPPASINNNNNKDATTTTTIFASIPNCGHLFHSDGKTVLIHAAPMMIDYIKADWNENSSKKDE